MSHANYEVEEVSDQQLKEMFKGLDAKIQAVRKEGWDNITDYIERMNRGIKLITHHQKTEISPERLEDVLLARSLGYGNNGNLLSKDKYLPTLMRLEKHLIDIELKTCLNHIENDYGLTFSYWFKLGKDFMTNGPKYIHLRDYRQNITINRIKQRQNQN